MTSRLDHLVVSVPDLGSAVDRWTRAGLEPLLGGRHPVGTVNALLRGPEPAYVELIAAEAEAVGAWPERVRAQRGPLSWALAVDDLDAARDALVEVGFDPGPVVDGARDTPDGAEVRWRTCDVGRQAFDPELPFLIEWTTPMPQGPAEGPVVEWVGVEVAEPERLSRMLRTLGWQSQPGPSDAVVLRDTHGVQCSLTQGTAGASYLTVDLATSQSIDTEIDGLTVLGTPGLRSHRGWPVLSEVRRRWQVGESRGEHRGWPDPWSQLGWDEEKPDGAYLEVTDAQRYRLLGERADLWLDVLVDEGLGRRVDVLPAGIDWREEPGLDVSTVTRLEPTVPGALPILVLGTTLDDLPDLAVVLAAGDPTVLIELVPDCGCDACDDGSEPLLDQIDQTFVHLLDGGLLQVRSLGVVMTTTIDGWSASGEMSADIIEGWLRGERLPPDVLSGAPWL